MYKVTKAMAESVKECIDTIYELTLEGYEGSFKSFNNGKLCKVASELVKRGVITRQRVMANKKTFYYYKWVAASAPTKTFYLSVAQALGDQQRKYDDIHKVQKKVETKEDNPITIVVPAEKADLSSATIEELWDELKSRGVVIEDNHLVIIERRVIA